MGAGRRNKQFRLIQDNKEGLRSFLAGEHDFPAKEWNNESV